MTDGQPGRGGWYEVGWDRGPERGPGYARAGAFLVLLGAAILLHQLVPTLDAVALLALGLGMGLAWLWLRGGSRLALWAAAVLLGYAVAKLLVGADVITGRGWTTLGIGLGLAAGWAAARFRGGAGTWALLLAALFALVGAAQLAQDQPFVRQVGGYAGPIVVIAIGLLLLGSQAWHGRGGAR